MAFHMRPRTSRKCDTENGVWGLTWNTHNNHLPAVTEEKDQDVGEKGVGFSGEFGNLHCSTFKHEKFLLHDFFYFILFLSFSINFTTTLPTHTHTDTLFCTIMTTTTYIHLPKAFKGYTKENGLKNQFRFVLVRLK